MSEPQPREELFAAIDKHATELQWSSDGSTYHATIADVEIVAFPVGGYFAARVQALGCSDDNTARIDRIVHAAQTQIVQRVLDVMAGESEPEPENKPAPHQDYVWRVRDIRATFSDDRGFEDGEEDCLRSVLERGIGLHHADLYGALGDAGLIQGYGRDASCTALGIILGSLDIMSDECKAAVKRYGENQ